MRQSIEGIRDPRVAWNEGALTGWAIIKPGPTHWYHVSRVVFVDDAWWELYWHECKGNKAIHDGHGTRGPSKARVREYAKNACALELLPDVYTKDGAQMNKLKVMP